MSNRQISPIDDILNELLLQELEPSHEALMKWCARYPEHEEALTNFFATWAVQDELPERIGVDETAVARRMVSHALNIVYRQHAASPAAPAISAVPRLGEAISASGLDMEEFACSCGLDESIVLKLDRRLIHLSSIPLVCFERMSRVLGHCATAVKDMLSGPPIPLRSYKARGQPTLKVEDFLDAVRASDLSDEAKNDWVQAIAMENTPEGN